MQGVLHQSEGSVVDVGVVGLLWSHGGEQKLCFFRGAVVQAWMSPFLMWLVTSTRIVVDPPFIGGFYHLFLRIIFSILGHGKGFLKNCISCLRSEEIIVIWYNLASFMENTSDLSFITAKDTKIDSRYSRWFNPPCLRKPCACWWSARVMESCIDTKIILSSIFKEIS